jgi:hypothetical protein
MVYIYNYPNDTGNEAVQVLFSRIILVQMKCGTILILFMRWY